MMMKNSQPPEDAWQELDRVLMECIKVSPELKAEFKQEARRYIREQHDKRRALIVRYLEFAFDSKRPEEERRMFRDGAILLLNLDKEVSP